MSAPASPPRVLLALADPDDPRVSIFLEAPWAGWDDVLRGEAATPEAVAASLGPVLQVPVDGALPSAIGAAAGLWVRDLDHLAEAKRSGAPWPFVVFAPSAVACLDALRKDRRTLVAARNLRRGQVIAEDDLATTDTGREGVGADRRQDIVGRRLAYPVPAGEPITYGYLEHG